MAENFLSVEPTELKFRFELRKNIPVTLTLHNPTSERVAFKVKTTSPKKYCVRPSSGFVEPNSSKEVQVIMQAQRECPPSLADCKDKFLIQCVRTGSSDAKEVTPDMFDATRVKDVRQTKLRVVLVAPPKPPSPVPEGNEEPASPATRMYKEAPSSLDAGGNAAPGSELGVSQLREQLASAAADKADMKRRLENLEGSSQGGRAAAAQAQSVPPAGFSLLHLLVVALLAFVLGYFLQIAKA